MNQHSPRPSHGFRPTGYLVLLALLATAGCHEDDTLRDEAETQAHPLACTEADAAVCGTDGVPLVCTMDTEADALRWTPIAACDDGDPCTTDVCSDGQCTVTANSEPCDDGDMCTTADTCAAGTCAGTAVTCDDGNACTDDGCNAETGCTSTPNTVACDDGSPCTENDACADGTCGGTAIDCDDDDPCTDDSCKPGLGCLHEPNVATCDDGDDGTRNDTCDGAGTCTGEPFECIPQTCEASSTPDGADCVVVFDDAGTACDDGDPTTGADQCDGSGACVGSPIVCTPNQCQVSATPNGTDCTIVNKPNGAPCDDGLAGTKDDVCNGNGACGGLEYTCTPTQCDESAVPNGVDCDVTWKAQDTPCDDGDPVTQNDVCDGNGVCAGTPDECQPTQCEATSTPSATGCDVTWKPEETDCDDGDPATLDDECDGAGTCAGTPYSCTVGTCETSSTPNGTDCTVVYDGAGTSCDDGNAATMNDVCDGNGGCAGSPIACPVTVCVTSSTPNGAGCDQVFDAVGTSCDDGDATTAGDICDGAGTCAGTPINCPTGACVASATPNGTDCTVAFEAAGTPCDDGNAATQADQCNGAGVCTGTPFACPTSDCVTASTPNGAGCDETFADSGTGCDDGDSTTADDTCDGAGACSGTAIVCTPGVCEAVSVPNGVDCTVTLSPTGTACDDGDITTADDACSASGACAGTPILCPTGPCVASSTPNGSSCDTTFVMAGTVCDDGNPATASDQCNGAGACQGAPIVCTPPQCMTGTPNGTDCTYAPADAGAACDDGNPNTMADVCDPGGACAGMLYTCSPAACEASSTPNGTDCTVVYKPNGSACNDGLLTTGSDVCNGSGICAGTPIDCTPTQCLASATPNGSGCDVTYKGAGTACDDGSSATSGDQCDGNGTCVGTPVDCIPDVCELSSTPNGTGGCDVVPKANGAVCDDGEPCTMGDACQNGTCTATGPTDCDDNNACTVDSCTQGVGCAHAATDCDDSDVCTDDVCDPGTGCANPANHCGNGTCDCGETTLVCAIDCLPAGAPDPDFGGGDGVVTADFVSNDEEAVAAAIVDGDKILIAGRARHATQGYNFFLARYLTNGQLDPNFGESSGFTQTDFGGNDTDRAYAMAVGPNRIVLVGHADDLGTGSTFAVAVYQLDGTLDTTFNAAGSKPGTLVNRTILASASTLEGVALEANGNIVVGGSGYITNGGGPRRAAVARLQPNGAFDTSFATNGSRIFPNVQDGEDGGLIIKGPAGSYRVVAATEWSYDDDLVLWGLTASGADDPTWGTSGLTRYDATPGNANEEDNPLDSAEYASAGLDDGAGRVLLGGTFAQQVPDPGYGRRIAAFRFLAGGTPDPDFGVNGVAAFPSTGYDAGGGVAVQADGKIVVCGQLTDGVTFDSTVAVGRFLSTGVPDPTFGTAGLQPLPTPGLEFSGADACVVQPDGKIVVVGSGFNGNDNDIFIIRVGQ